MSTENTKGVRELLLGNTYELQRSAITVALFDSPNKVATSPASSAASTPRENFLRIASEGSF